MATKNNSKEAEIKQRKIFRDNLSRELEKRGWKQKDLVERTGILKGTVSAWFTLRGYPGINNLQTVADALGLKKSELTEEHRVDKTQNIQYPDRDFDISDYPLALKYMEENHRILAFGGIDVTKLSEERLVALANVVRGREKNTGDELKKLIEFLDQQEQNSKK